LRSVLSNYLSRTQWVGRCRSGSAFLLRINSVLLAMTNGGPNVDGKKDAIGKLPAGHHLLRPRSIFAPNRRILINALPILLNVLLPWFFFTGCCALITFDPFYYKPVGTRLFLAFFGFVVFCFVIFALRSRNSEAEPTWYPMSAFMFAVAFVSSLECGSHNYDTYMRKYFEVTDLKVIGHVDPSQEVGQNSLDLGIAYFADGTQLEAGKAWHFKHDVTYCVAPITKGGAEPTSKTYDFWAVGKNCCALGAADFRCGDWHKAGVRAGIRALEVGDQANFQLAVKQAESLYDIKASHPIFLYWSTDPISEVDHWWKEGFMYFLFQSSCFFVFAIATVIMATCRFSCLGRVRSGYAYADQLGWDVHAAAMMAPGYAAANNEHFNY